MSTTTWKIRTIVVASVFALLLAGCGNDTHDNHNGGATVTASPESEPTVTPSPIPSETPEPEPQLQEQEVSIFLTDSQLTELIERKVTISFASDEDLIAKTMSSLQENEGTNVSLWHDITVESIKLEDGIATIDISFADETRLGAPGELMLIESLQQSMFQFSFVDGIQLLVNGETVESVMGHVELDHPMVRE
ncbi:GerMN domain-containing protein [Paenibacillus sp. strain BS8-2]